MNRVARFYRRMEFSTVERHVSFEVSKISTSRLARNRKQIKMSAKGPSKETRSCNSFKDKTSVATTTSIEQVRTSRGVLRNMNL